MISRTVSLTQAPKMIAVPAAMQGIIGVFDAYITQRKASSYTVICCIGNAESKNKLSKKQA